MAGGWLAVVLAGVVGAQDADGTIAVDQIHPAGASVHYVVTLSDADGEPVSGASVTATPTSPSGADGVEATLTETGAGIYEGQVEMATSGDWTVTFESSDPVAELEHAQTIPATARTGDAESDSSDTLVRAAIGLAIVAVGALVVWLFTGRGRDEAADGIATPDE